MAKHKNVAHTTSTPPASNPNHENLTIEKAHENNLKDISLSLPHNQIISVTGVSGSGKSSLAFDTIYAEGQRRYIETFSPYTRQFLSKVKKPNLESIGNVRAAIAIEQKTRINSSRSTVGSITTINDYFKTLWNILSVPHCPDCGIERKSWDMDSLKKHLVKLFKLKPHSQFLITAPLELPETKKGKKEEFDRLQVLGYNRYVAFPDTSISSLEDTYPEIHKGKQTHYVVLDRLRGGSIADTRLVDALQQSYSLTGGKCAVLELSSPDPNRKPWLRIHNTPTQITSTSKAIVHLFSSSFECEFSSITIPTRKPSIFSYNHPLGACEVCNGFGKVLAIDPNKIIPDKSKSIAQHAIHCWSGEGRSEWHDASLVFCKRQGIPVNVPWRDLTSEHTELLFTSEEKSFWGINAFFRMLERKIYKLHVRVFISKYRDQVDCHHCGGSRLKPGALAYKVAGKSLADLWNLPAEDLLKWLQKLASDQSDILRNHQVAEIFSAISNRLNSLCQLGLPYLTLERQAKTLSGGETQRVNLVAALGSGLSSTQFVLDEPSVGLHPRDTERLINALIQLRNQGNSVLVVEHDPEVIKAANTIIEIGPGAGSRGGHIVYAGPSSNWDDSALIAASDSYVGNSCPDNFLSFTKANARSLKNINVQIPLQSLTCITGLSGSGKSTLVEEVILANWSQWKQGLPPAWCDTFSGFEFLNDCLLIDQTPLSKTPRANIATYTKIWDEIRTLLAATDLAQTRGFTKSTFSFNVDQGRCTHCKGAGYLKEDMQFLSDVYILCEYCLGKRFSPAVLDVTFEGKTVHDYLNMTVEDAASFFSAYSSIQKTCEVLNSLGLGHLTLGHSLSELSGGEAQRLKLTPYAYSSLERPTLLIFDEPTTGLHVSDINRLLVLFSKLIANGHSVLCVEHNLQVIAQADWIIDLGPEGGALGGELIFQGTRRDFKATSLASGSLTAQYLWPSKSKSGKQRQPSPHALPPQNSPNQIVIRGANEHNLKNLSLTIPLGKMIAFTGVSGSGKSTLARDILFAEGQRRYLDCLSPYARQFIKELAKPDLEHIEGVPPSICVAQHETAPSRLSTVGTMTEVYAYLRLLYAKVGVLHCPEHPHQPISPLTSTEIVNRLRSDERGRIRLLSPVIYKRKGNHKAVIERAISEEISELRIDGVFVNPGKAPDLLDRHKTHTIEFVVASCQPNRIPSDALLEVVNSCLSFGTGTLIVVNDKSEYILSQHRSCPECGRGFHKLDPEDFSFSSRRGRCDCCDGVGLIDDTECKKCGGSRLNDIGRSVKIGNLSLPELCKLSASSMKHTLDTLSFSEHYAVMVSSLLQELRSKLSTLERLGLSYLPINRASRSLASGELQRLRLAAAIGSPLQGVFYVFDEPSASLHPKDTRLVLGELRELQQRGNTVALIEHDASCILASDYVVDIGPKGGQLGGELVYSGAVSDFSSCKKSITSSYLNKRGNLKESLLSVKEPAKEYLRISDASKHTISDLTATIPLNSLVAIAGVSGSGKSTLVHELVCDSWFSDTSVAVPTTMWSHNSATYNSTVPIDRVLLIDQKPLGATSRSTPASYLGIWDEIRKLYAQTLEARALGYSASYFSYNTGKGRCLECKGTGELTLEMSFLANARVQCPSCLGRRFREEANSIKFIGLSVSDCLNLTFEEAKHHFANHRSIHRAVHLACELGLDYLSLGQTSSTLSGGESQRLRLVSELATKRRGHTLYLLDEPSTGLHKHDISRLLKALRGLVQQGDSVWIIEHDEDLLCAADHIVELGPGAGEDGGKIIFNGSPRDLVGMDTPWGRELKAFCEV